MIRRNIAFIDEAKAVMTTYYYLCTYIIRNQCTKTAHQDLTTGASIVSLRRRIQISTTRLHIIQMSQSICQQFIEIYKKRFVRKIVTRSANENFNSIVYSISLKNKELIKCSKMIIISLTDDTDSIINYRCSK